jgi:hypothetical protein
MSVPLMGRRHTVAEVDAADGEGLESAGIFSALVSPGWVDIFITFGIYAGILRFSAFSRHLSAAEKAGGVFCAKSVIMVVVLFVRQFFLGRGAR